MSNVVRTLWGAGLQSSLFLKTQYEVLPFTTLNEKHEIQKGVLPAPGETPTEMLFVMGVGGHYYEDNATSIPKIKYYRHEPDHAALFRQLPMVKRLLSNDLTQEQRQQYAGRKVVTEKGIKKVEYWAKRLNLTDVETKYYRITTVNGVEDIKPYVPDSTNLNPQPKKTPADSSITTSNVKLAVSTIVKIQLTPFDVSEWLSVCNQELGDAEFGIVSEMAIVSGVNKIVQSEASGGASFNFQEVIAQQITSFLDARYDLVGANLGVEKVLDLGDAELLMTGVTNLTGGTTPAAFSGT